MQSAGYILIFKPTTTYIENQKITTKGNVDAEIVLYCSAKEFNNYNKAVIISGDGDFYCLAEYLIEQDKLLKIIVPNSKYSKLLRPFTKYIFRLDLLKTKLAYNKKPALAVGRNLRQSRDKPRSSGRSKP